MSNMPLIQCPDCNTWNSRSDLECLQCGRQFAAPHKRDARKESRENNRRRKQRFDDDDGDDGDMHGSDSYRSRR